MDTDGANPTVTNAGRVEEEKMLHIVTDGIGRTQPRLYRFQAVKQDHCPDAEL